MNVAEKITISYWLSNIFRYLIFHIDYKLYDFLRNKLMFDHIGSAWIGGDAKMQSMEGVSFKR